MILAASRLLYDLASPHHMVEKTHNNMANINIGRRPNVFASGTQKMLDVPMSRTLTARRWDRSLKEGGGRIWYSMSGKAEARPADPKLAEKQKRDMVIKTAYLRHLGHCNHCQIKPSKSINGEPTFRGSR